MALGPLRSAESETENAGRMCRKLLDVPLAIVDRGLDKVAKLPVGAGYVDLHAALTSAAWLARLEAGWKPRENLVIFGFGEVGARWGQPVNAMAGVGARLTF